MQPHMLMALHAMIGFYACILTSLVSCMSERLSECPRMTHSRPESFRISALHTQVVY